MGTVRARQKAKRTSKVTRRVKDKKRNVVMTANPIIEAHWDYNQTLKQNYKRLGLSVKLGREAGGAEADVTQVKYKEGVKSLKHAAEEEERKRLQDQEDLNKEVTAEDIPIGTAKIVKDKDGNLIKIIYGTKKPLDEDLELVDDVKTEPKTEVIKQLEDFAKLGRKDKRELSIREESWIKSLYEKYGDDYSRMKWDKKLNIYQQSEGDLRKRVLKWKKKNNL